MTTAYTSLLGLALPVQGELSGTWGDTVNNSITSLLDTSVAGTTNVSTDTDVTLTTTTGAANTARQAILLFSGARTALRTVTAPAQSKIYTVINATTGGFAVKLVGSGPTTGLTIPNGASAVVAWNGSDFVEVGAGSIGNLTVNGNLTVTGTSTLTGAITNTAGTANGVAYLNGSKVVTSGSALTFDGTTLTSNAGFSTGIASGGSYKLNYASNVDSRTWRAINDQNVFGDFAIQQSTTQTGTTYRDVYTALNSGVQYWSVGGSEQMRLTSTGLGIGTSSPAYKLSVAGNTASEIAIQAVNSGIGNTGYRLQNSLRSWAIFVNDDSSGPLRFYDYTAGAERMRLDSSGHLGIGTSSPAGKLQVSSNNVEVYITDSSVSAPDSASLYLGISTVPTYSGLITDFTNDRLNIRHNQATRATFDSSGNLGLGVTPSAWASGFKAIQISANTALWSSTTSGSGPTYLSNNVYFDGARKYIGTGASAEYQQNAGSHIWQIAPSGTAGNAITFTQAMTLDASGNVQIGTTTSSGRLHLASSGSTAQTITSVGTNVYSSISFNNTTTGYGYDIGFGGSASVAPNSFYVYGGSSASVKMMIDSSGNLGLGVTPSAWGGTRKVLQLKNGYALNSVDAGTLYGTLSVNYYNDGAGDKFIGSGYAVRYEQNSGGAHSWAVSTASGTAGNAITFTQALTLTSAGELLVGLTSGAKFSVSYGGNDTHFGLGANYDNYITAGSSGVTIFRNTSTERARIDSSGNLLVGTTSTLGGAKQTIYSSNLSLGNGLSIQNGTAHPSGAGSYIQFYNSASATAGYINQTGTTTVAYTTSSDYRLKENVTPMTGALAKVSQLKPVTYKWKSDGLDGEGFIAHELAEVCPQAVVGEKDAVDAEGNPKYQGIDTSFLVATLTAAIQEQQAIIESLKARLDAANL